MRLPLDKLAKLVQGWRSPKQAIPRRCVIDQLPMKLVGYTADGEYEVYECAMGHTYSPGLNVGDKGGLIARNSGDTKGEI